MNQNSKLLKNTSIYPMYDVKVCGAKEVAKVPDILSGGTRKRRFGLLLSMSGFPEFSKVQDPIFTPAQMDTMLIDADSLDDLKARAYQEIDAMIAQIKTVLDGVDTKTNETSTQESTNGSPV